ncbi:MAG: hypothetical protein AB7O98_14680 [Hyphomonadaceae bacterium]
MEAFYIIGAFVLAAAIGFGVYRDRTRDRSNDALTAAAAKEQYEHPETYQQTQKAFEEAAND